MFARLLPPATKLGQGYVFTGVCDSVNRGGGGYLTPPPEQTPPRSRPPPQRACCEIRSTRGWYASYWNAILLYFHVVSFSWLLLEPLLFTVRNEVAKVMFLHVSVSHSVYRVGCAIPACIAGGIPACLAAGSGAVLSQHALQVVSQHALQWGGGVIPACIAGGIPACLAARGVCSWGVPAPGGCGDPPPKADGYCCGRYASYWNAFLLNISHALCLQPVLLIVMVLPIHLRIQTVLIHKSNSSRVIK